MPASTTVRTAGVGAAVELFEEGGQRRARVVRWQRHGGVVVDPRAVREVPVGGVAGQQRMAVPGDDARGHVDEAVAAQRRGQEFAGVDAAAVQVAAPAGEAAQPLRAGGGVEDEPDAGVFGGGTGPWPAAARRRSTSARR